jgi:hypothetical protein
MAGSSETAGGPEWRALKQPLFGVFNAKMETVLVLIPFGYLIFNEIADCGDDFCPYSQFRRRINATCVFYSFLCHNDYGSTLSSSCAGRMRLSSILGDRWIAECGPLGCLSPRASAFAIH